jgi:phosphate transport system permease protein
VPDIPIPSNRRALDDQAQARKNYLSRTLDRAKLIDRFGKFGITLAAAIVLFGVGLILVFLVLQSLPLIMDPVTHAAGTVSKMFLPQKYEGYQVTQYFWQTETSEGGQEKYGVPLLIWGTIKGAFWAMFFSAPLAILTALFIAEFCPPGARTVVKSSIELMAGIPTVVVGFVAFVTLSPVLNQYYLAHTSYFANGQWVLAFIQLLFFAFVSASFCAKIAMRRYSAALKVFGCIAVVILSALATTALGRLLESVLGSTFKPIFGVGQYTQLNGILAGFCLGFAIIPIIFSVSEDAMRAVPQSFREASLALGGSKWETALRVVLPAALPGVYASLMLGLARAVGETMIVLMASGNTAIFDLSPFNGMRTMSAAIAIEASEKAQYSTGYHVLFFVGTVLFLMTLILNVATGQIITRLKKRYHVG